MSAINSPRGGNRSAQRSARTQRGMAAVEFGMLAMFFFTMVFGIIEMARAMYICNTLQEVTRLAAAGAANADFTNASAMQKVRQAAIFRDSPGNLVFADPISDQYVRIDYMYIPLNATAPVAVTGSLPASPEANRINCLRDANAATCLRLVRARICVPGDAATCTPVPYTTLVSMIDFAFPLPTSTTIAKIETLGMAPKVPPSCGC